MTKILYLGLIVFALTAFVGTSSADAQCAYSSGYGNSYYAPSYGYSNSYYAPSYRYGNNGYYGNNSYYGNRSYYGNNSVRSQRVRTLATAAIIAGCCRCGLKR